MTEHYRNFLIDHAYVGYQAVHKDYDGPEDNRIFHANTIDEVREEVDEYWLENCDECDGEGLIWNNNDLSSGQCVSCENCGGLR